ncbi:MAG TPA: hypothetical protein VEF90_16470 [Xanthobacteraceae bacterium]|nr:hypothetical protein [Xanthobacteraceae bacterium]
MISAGEVGALFKVVDEASPVLRRLMDQFNALQGVIDRTKAAMAELRFPTGLNKSISNMGRALKGVADQTKLTTETVGVGFKKIDESVSTTTKLVADLRKEMSGLASASRGVGRIAPSIRNGDGARSSGGSGSGGVHFSGASVPLPGDQHMRISGTPLLAGAGAVAYGAYEEAKIQDFVNRIFLTGGISTGKETANPLYGKIRDAILKAYTMTGLPLEQIEEGILAGTRGLAGIDLEKRLALMPGLLASSATEAYLKAGTTIPEAMQVFVGLAHMEGKYSPAEIAKLADHFAFLSTTTPVSVEQIERAAGYAIPMLRTANFDPEQVLLMITAMERAGIMNTKAGTWISQLATRSFPGTSLMSKMLFRQHEPSLRKLGLIDDRGNPTWFTDGRPDLVKMTGIAGERIEKLDVKDRLAVEKALWGDQGGRAAAFFSDPTNRSIMAAVAGEEKDFISGEAMWKQSLENSPIVQFRTAFAGLNVELMNLGSNVLPYATSMLQKANETLGGKGELAAIAAGVVAFFNRGAIWSGAKSIFGRFLNLGGGAASLPAVVDFLTDDNRTPEAKANDAAILAWLKGEFSYGNLGGQGQPIDPWALERSRRNAARFRDDPETVRAEIMRSGDWSRAHSAPQPVVNLKAVTTVTIDGKNIPSMSTTRVTHDTSGFDGQADTPYPDHGFH